MQKFEEPVQNLRGDTIAKAPMLVMVAGTNTPATVFSDAAGLAVIKDPRSDAIGVFSFYAPNGRYDVYAIVDGKRKGFKLDILLYDPAEAVGEVTPDAFNSLSETVEKLATDANDAGIKVNELQKDVRERLSILRYLPPNYVTDGSVDYTIQLQMAINAAKDSGKTLEGAPGVFAVSGDGLLIEGPFMLRGSGKDRFTIKNANGTVLCVKGAAIDIDGVEFWSQGGGHTVVQSAIMYQSSWTRHRIRQDSPDFSCWDNAGFEYVDNRHTYFDFIHVLGAEVPGFNLTAAGGLINDNLFADGRATNCGMHFFRVRSTTGNYQYGNKFKGITFEVCRGGGIDMQAAMLFEVDGCQNWDADAGMIFRNFYDIALNSEGINSVGKIQGCGRWAGSNIDGVCDVRLPSGGGGAGIEISNCSTSGGGDPFTINCANNSVRVRINADSLMALVNGDNALIIRPSGIQFPGSAKQLTNYDEGNWVPTIGSSGSFAYSSQVGKWTRVGRQVTVQGYIALSTAASASGPLVITGLPFQIPNSLANYGSAQVSADGFAASASGQITGNGSINGSAIVLKQFSAGVLSDIASALKDGATIKFSYTYFLS